MFGWKHIVATAAVLASCTLEVACLKSRATLEAPVTPAKAREPSTAAQAQVPSTAAQVQALRSKLEKMATGLDAASCSMTSTKIGPELKAFVAELHTVLKETKGMADNAAALKKLEAARQGVIQLTKDLSARQEAIMKDEESQKESLLLGVLMTHQKEPMSEQLKVLSNEDFTMLPVSKALLASHNNSAPLFGQVAAYLDTHKAKGIAVRTETEDEKKARQAAMAATLQKVLDSMQKSYDARVLSHAKHEKEFQAELKSTTSKKTRHMKQAIRKGEERKFKKWAATQKHTIETMKKAIAGVKAGDMSAVNQAKAALQHAMQALKDNNSGFLVLLSLGHRLMGRDCPFCVAQCLDKCHTAGKSYVQCMTDCEYAGQ